MASDSRETQSFDALRIEQAFEFLAPRFFDFINNESEEETHKAELWLEKAPSYAASTAFMPKIKTDRSVRLGNFRDEKQQINDSHASQVAVNLNNPNLASDDTRNLGEPIVSTEIATEETLKCEEKNRESRLRVNSAAKPCGCNRSAPQNRRFMHGKSRDETTSSVVLDLSSSRAHIIQDTEACTPKSQIIYAKGEGLRTSLKNQTTKKIATSIRKPSTIKPKNQSLLSKAGKPTSMRFPGSITAKDSITADFAQENQSIKRQKLGEGRSRQDETTSTVQRMHKLTLTRPKEPELETAKRANHVTVKSSADLEEEMLANLPKFKARAVNKKILEAPSTPALPKSTPRLPEFKEFHLKTMERANQHASASSVSPSIYSSCQNESKPHHKLTEPQSPHLETSLRARPTNIKSSQELEMEELEKVKFKARPLNKKILESRGELGLFCTPKRQLTTPLEFHFATNERIPPTKEVTDLFDKISLNSKGSHDQQNPRITTPNPFHLRTEERGLEKQKTFEMEVLQQQLAEDGARIPKAYPYPHTTDCPVLPPKPKPKKCTKPEAFQLESLVRHEAEMQKKMEERDRMEKEAEQMRIFRAKPIQKDDPLPVPDKARRPLTQIQEFVLHVDHRAIDREEFHKKIKEKELMYKRYRKECEAVKMLYYSSQPFQRAVDDGGREGSETIEEDNGAPFKTPSKLLQSLPSTQVFTKNTNQ